MTSFEKPEIALNQRDHTVAESLNGFISHAATGFVGGAGVDIATAYFNVGGYSLLADSLDKATNVRLLFGAEPTPPENRQRNLGKEHVNPERAAKARLRQALGSHDQTLRIERDQLGFTAQADAVAHRLVQWLRSGKVQVRRLEGRFLHGKAFLVGDRSHGVIAGSSNLTSAGLTTNLELNLGNYSPHVVAQVKDWFEELWEEATDYDLAALFEARFEPHLPQLIYLRMLWERYGSELQEEATASGAPQIHLTAFQTDGLWRARRILEQHHGVLIADEVGLGKTFLAGELIREAALERRQTVLVIAPATLRDGPWRAFRTDQKLYMELRSYEDLLGDSRLNPDHARATKLDSPINDYALIVIDEAHNLRNPSTQRAHALRRLLAGSPPKKLVMLTATPVNNSLWDLYHLLGYFLRNDAAFAEVGIRSLRDHFANAMQLNPDDLTPEHLFDVLDTVAVRRTRSFVKRFYPNDTIRVDGEQKRVIFPTPRVKKVTYDMDAVLPGFFDRFAHALHHEADGDDPDRDDADGDDPDRDDADRVNERTQPAYQRTTTTAPAQEQQTIKPPPTGNASTGPPQARDENSPSADRGGIQYGPPQARDKNSPSADRGSIQYGPPLARDENSPSADRGGIQYGPPLARDADTLMMAMHAPSQYRRDRDTDAHEVQLAGLLRSLLLKRFESSPHAFAMSCERMAKRHAAFLSLLDQGRVATGEVLTDWLSTDSDEFTGEQLDTYLDGIVGVTEDASLYFADRLRDHVIQDQRLLQEFAAEARRVRRVDDPNLAALSEALAEISAEADHQGIGASDIRDRRKVLIFSYFTDTVEWIFEYLQDAVATDERLAVYRDRIASITGSSHTEGMERKGVLWGFAPRTTDAPADFAEDRYDIVVSTDVLAEGVNLQQARHIINYDLPWNPMRLVQRHGRIDRIGSSHSEVFLRCVFPDSRLDDLLRLEERLHRKIAQAAASVGVGEVLPDQTAQRDVNFTETREEIERIRSEDASLFERGSTARGALSGEEFRQEMRAAFEDVDLIKRIESLPWGSGSGMTVSTTGRQPGYVFCARVGDHPRPQFRFVATDRSGDHPITDETKPPLRTDHAVGGPDHTITDETLACLDAARPADGFDTPRQLDDASVAGAFEAWTVAQADIVKKWNYLADKANLEPTVPPRLRRAAELLEQHPPPGLDHKDLERALDTIRAPYPERTIRTIQSAMSSADDPAEQVQNILGVIKNLGLQPYEAPQPLPEIATQDVHLVVWLALTVSSREVVCT